MSENDTRRLRWRNSDCLIHKNHLASRGLTTGEHIAVCTLENDPGTVAEMYYQIDDDVVRELLGKKLGVKVRKELDDVAEAIALPPRSCRRIFDNVTRMMAMLEETTGFHCCVADVIMSQYLLPRPLATRYACLCFVLVSKFTLARSNRRTAPLSLDDILLVAAMILVNWVGAGEGAPGSSGSTSTLPTMSSLTSSASSGATLPFILREPAPVAAPTMGELQERLCHVVGFSLDQQFIQALRDIKVYLSNERSLDQLQTIVHRDLTEMSAIQLSAIDLRFKAMIKALVTIGAGLSLAKEQRDLFEDLVIKLGEPLQLAGVDAMTAAAALDAVARAFPTVIAAVERGEARQRFLSSVWGRFIAVVRVFALRTFGKFGGANYRRPSISFD